MAERANKELRKNFRTLFEDDLTFCGLSTEFSIYLFLFCHGLPVLSSRIFALNFSSWKYLREMWITRKRKHAWPSLKLAKKIENFFCFKANMFTGWKRETKYNYSAQISSTKLWSHSSGSYVGSWHSISRSFIENQQERNWNFFTSDSFMHRLGTMKLFYLGKIYLGSGGGATWKRTLFRPTRVECSCLCYFCVVLY